MKKIIALMLILSMALSLCACKSSDYKEAMDHYDSDKFSRARKIFAELGDYKDSAEMVLECDYQQALVYMDEGDLSEARELFLELGDYEDSARKASECGYQLASACLDEGDLSKARELFLALGDYMDSAEMVSQCDYRQALACMDVGDFVSARALFLELGDYEDCRERVAHAARGILINYVKENEIPDSKVTDGTYIRITENDGALLMAYVMEFTGIINMDVRIGMQFYIDGTGLLAGSEDVLTHAADWEAEAASDWDISAYESGDALGWDHLEASGYNANGKVYDNESTLMLRMLQTAALEKSTAYLAQVLADSGLGLTMADIGFISY